MVQLEGRWMWRRWASSFQGITRNRNRDCTWGTTPLEWAHTWQHLSPARKPDTGALSPSRIVFFTFKGSPRPQSPFDSLLQSLQHNSSGCHRKIWSTKVICLDRSGHSVLSPIFWISQVTHSLCDGFTVSVCFCSLTSLCNVSLSFIQTRIPSFILFESGPVSILKDHSAERSFHGFPGVCALAPWGLCPETKVWSYS